MGNRYRREEWLQDFRDRQRNTVFPDTARNEAKFWRNLADTPWKTSTAVGMAVLGAFVFTSIGIFVVASLEGGLFTAVAMVFGTIFLGGSAFAAIAWATKRSLREVEKMKSKGRQSRKGPIPRL